MRIFIALEVPEETRQKIASIIGEYQALSEQGRFVREELLHLTLEFMGSLDEQALECLIGVLAGFRFQPFTVTMGEAGWFPGRKGRTLWLSVEAAPELLRLQRDLHHRLSEAGFALEKRPFHPHITLGRDVRLAAASEGLPLPVQEGASISFEAACIHVMESAAPGGFLSYTSRHRISADGSL